MRVHPLRSKTSQVVQFVADLLMWAVGLMVLAVWSPLAVAQNSGTIVGTVTDPSGATVSSVEATAVEVSTNVSRRVTANAQGYYVISSLPPSQYRVIVKAAGFAEAIHSDVVLQADQTMTVNAQLKVGAANSSVTIDAAPPQVDTTTSTLGQVIDQTRMVELPLNGRNAATLTTLVAGAVSAPSSGAVQSSTFAAAVTVSTNGSQATSANYLLDGADNVDQYTNVNQPVPMPDSLQEFSVQTSSYGAQYGGNSGAVVNVVTKSGTNKLTGNLFEFVRNSDLNARNWAATSRDTIKRNQFGGTLGGPVFVPKLYNGKNRTFFFFGYQATIFHSASASSKAFVPTAADLNGDFSAMLSASNPSNPLGKAVQLIDPSSPINPATGQHATFPGNKIPTSRFDPASLNVVKLLPTSTTINGLTNYQQPSAAQDYRELLLRIDHVLSPKDHLSGRYFRDIFVNPALYVPGNVLTYRDGQPNVSQNFLADETHIFNSAILNDLHFTYSEVNGSQNPPSNAPDYADLGVNMYQPSGTPKAIESISISGLFSFGDHPFGVFVRHNYIWGDDLKWVHGRNSFDFGGMVQYGQLDVTNNFRRFGAFSFSGDATGFAMADFLLGSVRSFSQTSGQFQNERNTLFSLYVQDDFHATPRLTLNLGLRYDPYRPWNEIKGREEMFSPSAYQAGQVSTKYTNAPPGLFFAGDPGFPRGGSNGAPRNFAPRVGFAYDLTGDAKTSVRGGFGLFYDSRGISQLTQAVVSLNPFSPGISLTTLQGPFSNPYLGVALHPPFTLPAPSNYVFPTGIQALTFDPINGFHVPLTYNWNLTFERQLGSNWMARASYVGSRGEHLRRDMNLAPGIYNPNGPAPFNNPNIAVTSRTAYSPAYSGIGMLTQSGGSNYNSFQSTLQRRLAHSLTILASYTWSKSLDDIPPGQTLQAGGGGSFAEPIYVSGFSRFEYGPSPFDHTHNFVMSYVWQLPQFSNKPRWVQEVAGNWGWSGIFSANTGDAMTISAGTDVAAVGTSERAIISGAPYGGKACTNPSVSCANWLNPASFSLPLSATKTPAAQYVNYPFKYGNTSKGGLRGPGHTNWDMSIYKNIGLTEHAHLQFRAEAFNTFNHTPLGDPVTSLNSGGFGSILSAGDPRIMQLGLKLVF
jgi:hypothetical protein